MKLGLFGYGKMGKTIETIALQRGHSIVLKVDRESEPYSLSGVDVAIDFSTPESAVQNISECIHKNLPVISGTTGWLKDYDTVVDLCKTNNGTFLYASNFSLGVNLFFELNKTLAKLMRGQSQYQVDIEEIHHTQKLDAPSGTAITLAQDIIMNSDYNSWTLSEPTAKEIGITAKRIENISGTHTIQYKSDVDSIEITHTAFSRDGFALGAVIAAEWIHGKKGVFTMKDVLNMNS